MLAILYDQSSGKEAVLAGHYMRAASLYKSAAEEAEKDGNEQRLLFTLLSLADCYSKQKLFAEAEVVLRRCMVLTERADGNAQLSISIKTRLAMLFIEQRQWVEAEPLRLLRALNSAEKIEHFNKDEILRCLSEVYTAQGKSYQAEAISKTIGPKIDDAKKKISVLLLLYTSELMGRTNGKKSHKRCRHCLLPKL